MFCVSSNSVTPNRKVLFECTPFYYPFGNTEARDLFEVLNLKSKECRDPVKILFLGCGDLRHSLITATGKREDNRLEIHLNDVNPSIIARNVLIFSIITSEDFDREGDEGFKFMWDVWYNAFWSESTSAKFLEKVRDLIGGTLPKNVTIPRREDREALNEVWRLWLALFGSKGNMDAAFVKEIIELRKRNIIRGWLKFKDDPKLFAPNVTTSLSEAAHGLAENVEHQLYEGKLPDEGTKRKIRHEFVHYFEHGYCFTGNGSGIRITSVNPTLLIPATKKWFVQYKLNPFEGFFNLFKQNISKVKTYRDERTILLKNSQAVLRNIIETFRKNCRDTVRFTFHLSEAVEFCLNGLSGTFDVIDSSNLADNIGLANILVSARHRLSKDNANAIIITESMKWSWMTKTIEEYIQKTLGTPLSMIPTVYGLKLVNTVELGTTKLSYLQLPASLIWRRCPEYQNVTLSPSKALRQCFGNIFPLCLRGHETGGCGTVSYSLLTYHLIAHDLCKRFRVPANEADPTQFLPPSDVVPEQHRLQLRTLDFWAKGRRLSKFTSVMDNQQIYPEGRDLFQLTHSYSFNQSTPVLQLLLIPKKYATNFHGSQLLGDIARDVHVIDTFTFRFVSSEDHPERLEAVVVSFILPEETTIEFSHVAVIVDVSVKLFGRFPTTKFYLGEVKNLTKEPFNQAYPIQFKPETSSQEQSSEAKLKMIECLESEDKYVVKFEGGKQTAPTFLSDQESPCESAHVLRISQKNITQSFQFSHAFVVDDVTSTMDTKSRTLKVAVPKALYEPWPFQFGNTKKLDTSRLKLWSERASLAAHLGNQFKLDELMALAASTDLVRATPLSEVRQVIRYIFSSSFENGSDEFFGLKAGWTQRPPIWYLRVHPPVCVGPNGEPLLAVTAIDHCKAQEMVDRGRMSVEKSSMDFRRVMVNDFSGQVYNLTMPTPQGSQLFRYLLRLNSIKMEANAWQKRHLPKREKNDPLFMFATYLSPLYGDGELLGGAAKSFIPMQSTINPFQRVPPSSSSCVTCGKRTDLKKCSRCKSVSYCGTVCQRTDWPLHKSNCHPKH